MSLSLAAPILLLALAGDGTPSAPAPEEVLALVQGTAVTRRDLRIRLARRHRGTEAGKEAERQSLDKILVAREMEKRGVTVEDDEISARLSSLGIQVERESGGSTTLEEELARVGVELEAFRAELVFLVGLEKMARADFGTPAEIPLPPVKLNLWIEDLRDSSKIEKLDTSSLPPGEDGPVARFRGGTMTLEQLGEELEGALPADQVQKELRVLVGKKLISTALEARGLEVVAADLDAEIVRRSRALVQDTGIPGISYPSVLEAQGLDEQMLRTDEEFVTEVGVRKLVLAEHDEADYLEVYEQNQDLYGPSVQVRHLFLRAREDDDPYRTSGRTFAEAKKAIEGLRKQLDDDPTLSFTDLIQKSSESPSTSGVAGDLGFIHRKNPLGEEFFDVASALEPGDVSRPVKSKAGYHLLQVMAKKPAPPFEEVRDAITGRLAKELFQRLWSEGGVEIRSGERPAPGK